jgi:hypothetical protein
LRKSYAGVRVVVHASVICRIWVGHNSSITTWCDKVTIGIGIGSGASIGPIVRASHIVTYFMARTVVTN